MDEKKNLGGGLRKPEETTRERLRLVVGEKWDGEITITVDGYVKAAKATVGTVIGVAASVLLIALTFSAIITGDRDMQMAILAEAKLGFLIMAGWLLGERVLERLLRLKE
jgi:hypothetical protein